MPEGEVTLDWTRAIDGYCERTDPSYWSEPVNAATNAAFLIAAVVMWRRVRGQDLPLAALMVAILAAIVGFVSIAYCVWLLREMARTKG